MKRTAALDFLTQRRRGVLVTLKGDGRPQLSNVLYLCRGERVEISVTESRAKTRNAARDPRVSLHVTSDDFWRYVVAEGLAELTPPSRRPGDEVGVRLVELYEQISGGPHPDWDEFLQAMVDEQRLVLAFSIAHVYGRL